MSLPLFLARRLYREEEGRKASRPAVLIATLGVAIGLAVMIVSVAVIIGFKRQIRDKIEGFGAQVRLDNLHAARSFEAQPIGLTPAQWDTLRALPQVAHAQRFSTKPGMLKTSDSFQGMVLKGVGQEYDLSFFERHLVAGEVPVFTDSTASNRVLLSQSLAQKLRLGVGDKIDTYFIHNQVRARRFRVAGIYQTNFSEFDNLFVVTDLHTVNRLNQWKADRSTGVEVQLVPGAPLDAATYAIGDWFEGQTDAYGDRISVRNVEQLYPQIFAWLDILDVNIWVILILMTGVAGFTMVSGLLIIIIERTSMIGVLKALGAGNGTVRRLFLWLGVFLIGRGMLWGNVIGLGLVALQKWGGVFKLDAATYYMDTVPVSFVLGVWLLLNIGTLLASVLMLLAPSLLITRIHPATSIRYE